MREKRRVLRVAPAVPDGGVVPAELDDDGSGAASSDPLLEKSPPLEGRVARDAGVQNPETCGHVELRREGLPVVHAETERARVAEADDGGRPCRPRRSEAGGRRRQREPDRSEGPMRPSMTVGGRPGLSFQKRARSETTAFWRAGRPSSTVSRESSPKREESDAGTKRRAAPSRSSRRAMSMTSVKRTTLTGERARGGRRGQTRVPTPPYAPRSCRSSFRSGRRRRRRASRRRGGRTPPARRDR